MNDDDAKREREREMISGGKCEHCCVISPLCQCVGDCLQSQISVEISFIHLQSLYTTHMYTYTPTCIPSLQMPLHLYLLWHPRRHFLEKMKRCWWLPCLKLSVFSSFIMSVSPYRLFSCVIYCVFLSCTALCCLFIDCECLWMNCTDWLDHWWFHFSTYILGSV